MSGHPDVDMVRSLLNAIDDECADGAEWQFMPHALAALDRIESELMGATKEKTMNEDRSKGVLITASLPSGETIATWERDARGNLVDFAAAIEQLRVSAETCEGNAPIHEAMGNAEQAALSRANAANYRAAIARLQG